MRREFIAAPLMANTLGVLPLFIAGGAAAGRCKGVPHMAAGARPVGAAIGFPGAFRAFYFNVV